LLANGIRGNLPPSWRMVRKSGAPPGPFTRYENFLYLLTELEMIIGSGKIEWSVASAIVARHRLDKLTAAVHQLVSQLENE
jgi:hypothetical protein